MSVIEDEMKNALGDPIKGQPDLDTAILELKKI